MSEMGRETPAAFLLQDDEIRSVPWSLVAPSETQAKRNHGGQSLARLAERRGLGVVELYYVLRSERYNFHAPVSEEFARRYLRTRLELHGEHGGTAE